MMLMFLFKEAAKAADYTAKDDKSIARYDDAVGKKEQHKELMALGVGMTVTPAKPLTRADEKRKIAEAREELAIKRLEAAERAKEERAISQDMSRKKAERRASLERAEAYEQEARDIGREERKLSTKRGQEQFLAKEAEKSSVYTAKDDKSVARYDDAVAKKAQHKELMALAGVKVRPLTEAERGAKIAEAREELSDKRIKAMEKANAEKAASKDKSLTRSERKLSRERAAAYEETAKAFEREEKKLSTARGQSEFLETRVAEYTSKDDKKVARYDAALGKKAQHKELMELGTEKTASTPKKPRTKTEKEKSINEAREELDIKRLDTAEKERAARAASKDKSLSRSERKANRELAEDYARALDEIKRDKKQLSTKRGQEEYLESKSQPSVKKTVSKYDKNAYLDDASVIKQDKSALAMDAKKRSNNSNSALSGRYESQLAMYKKRMSEDDDLFY